MSINNGRIILSKGQSYPSTIGHNIHYFISRDIILDCRGYVEISKSAHFGRGVKIISAAHEHGINGMIPGEGKRVHVTVEDSVFVYAYAIIYGSFVGQGSIVSAGTVLLNQHVMPYTLVAGNPAKAIGFYDFEQKRWRYNEQKYEQVLGLRKHENS